MSSRVLNSTMKLLENAGEKTWIDRKRLQTVSVTIAGVTIDIRDQQPLYAGKTQLHGGWKFEDLIRALNSRVFFWPGWEEKPIGYGLRHFSRYEGDSPVLLRIASVDAFALNEQPLFCKYNSGSPRTTRGKGSPRGPSTFVESGRAPFTPSQVVEVTFSDSASLPRKIEWSTSPYGPWASAAAVA